MNIVAYSSALLALLASCLLFPRLKSPWGILAWFPKLAAGALSPFWGLLGISGAILGWLNHAPLAIAAGCISALIMAWYVWRVTAQHKGFEGAFGADWQQRILSRQQGRLLARRWTWLWRESRSPEPRWERNLPFWTIPESDRQLLCDIWQPPLGADSSGLAFIFFHGSAWYMLDKDFGTRPFFRHLVRQGHVVMDVAYRLCPEVDIYGMLGDVKRAIVWMKQHADQYGVTPDRIVLGGASAGGHLSMLAAYAPQHPQLTPPDVEGFDLAVSGVVSYYGPADLRAVYEHTNQKQLVGLPKVAIGQADALNKTKRMKDAGRLDILLGGHPNEIPEVYDLASPITHLHAGCPPTLLIQGDQDWITPVTATCILHRKLVERGVPAVNVVFPCTNHAFDLFFPQISPTAQSALYDVDRFLALML